MVGGRWRYSSKGCAGEFSQELAFTYRMMIGTCPSAVTNCWEKRFSHGVLHRDDLVILAGIQTSLLLDDFAWGAAYVVLREAFAALSNLGSLKRTLREHSRHGEQSRTLGITKI
jgi:hypothetical protein